MSRLSTQLSSSIPEFASPPTPRLQSLYSDISKQKYSNPTGYQANVSWWRNTLERIVESGWQQQSTGKSDRLILSVDDALVDSLKWEKVGKPLGLGSAVIELSVSGHIIPYSTFLSSSKSIYSTAPLPLRVASYVIGKPLWWVLEQLNIVGDSDSGESSESRWKRARGEYVFLAVLEKAANNVLYHLRNKPQMSLTENLFTTASFRSEFASIALPDASLSDTDIKVLIKYLERDKQALVVDKGVIKFVEGEALTGEVTEIDRGVVEMKSTIEKLNSQVDEIQRQIEERTTKIKQFIASKRKELAISYLRSRKQLEELLLKRLNSLETIQSILLKIDSAATDIDILKTYETSSQTLRTLLSHPTLQQLNIDKTMEDMAEALANHAEIDEAIRLGGAVARDAGGEVDFDEKELEDELEGLVKEETARQEKEAKEKREREEREKEEKERQARELEVQEELERQKALLASLPSPVSPVDPSVDEQWALRYAAGQVEKEIQRKKNLELERRKRAKWELEDSSAS